MTFFPCSYRITLIQMPRLSRLRRLQPLKVETSKNQLQKLKQQVIFYFNYPHQISLSEVRVNTVQLLIPCVILPDSDNGSSSTQIPSGDERWISTPSVSPPPQRFPRACFMCVRAIEDQEAFDKHMEEHRNMPLLHCIICKKGFLNEKLLVLHKQVIHPNLCEICNLELESTRMQIDHMLEYHPDVVDDIPFGEWHAGIVCLTLILRSNFNVLTSGLMFAINVFNVLTTGLLSLTFSRLNKWLFDCYYRCRWWRGGGWSEPGSHGGATVPLRLLWQVLLLRNAHADSHAATWKGNACRRREGSTGSSRYMSMTFFVNNYDLIVIFPPVYLF